VLLLGVLVAMLLVPQALEKVVVVAPAFDFALSKLVMKQRLKFDYLRTRVHRLVGGNASLDS
jgi:hypothetical protein